MEQLEIKDLQSFSLKYGASNIQTALLPWCDYGFVLIFKAANSIYVLRTKHEATPRIFKTTDTAISICKNIGFTKVVVTFEPKDLPFEKPNWVKKV